MVQPNRRGCRPVLDRLESRQLPAVGVTAALYGGILAVQGTDGNDVIRVRVRPEGPRGTDVIEVEGVTRPIPAGRVRLVVVAGGAGDDAIIMDDLGRGTVPVWFDGGPGSDFLFGGAASDVLLVGEGDDVIFGNGDHDHIDAGPGQNLVNGDPVTLSTRLEAEPIDEAQGQVALSPIVSEIVEATNRQRRQAGLSPLQIAPALLEAARLQAEEMARIGRLDHELPGSAWPTLQDRAQHVGYAYSILGENLAFNYQDAESVVNGWMASAGHRSNLLRAEFTEVGVAVATNFMNQKYYVQVLGNPL
ncbi:hypothetical protein BH23PLA1_BH23PLA1_25470 [soil metagenome]